VARRKRTICQSEESSLVSFSWEVRRISTRTQKKMRMRTG
jgi:hypothetical protein